LLANNAEVNENTKLEGFIKHERQLLKPNNTFPDLSSIDFFKKTVNPGLLSIRLYQLSVVDIMLDGAT